MSINPDSFHPKFKSVISRVSQDIGALRTGKASIQMLDDVLVDAYGSKMKINELANITVPDTSLLVISPWDKSVIADIEKAIMNSQLSLNAVVDGDIIRVPVPSLTQERRLEMVKMLQKKIESGKVMLRSVRNDAKKDIEGQKGESGISEDDIAASLEDLDKIVKKYIEEVDAMSKAKEAELMSI